MKKDHDCIHIYHNMSSLEDKNKLEDFCKSKFFINMTFNMCIQFLDNGEIPYYKLKRLINLLDDLNKLFELKSLTQIKLSLNMFKDIYKYESELIIDHANGNERICKYIYCLTEGVNAFCNFV